MNKIVSNSGIEIFKGDFELIESGFSTGKYNMEFDICRAHDCAEAKALPMFRLYGWKPWAVSLGTNQRDRDIDIDVCRVKGFDIVRRPTGGRAVLHANELTYSVVTPLPESMNVHEAYKEIHEILLSGFRNLGCKELDFEKSQADFRNLYKDPAMSISCFASSAKYEISFSGRKVVGSAQRLYGNILLQHGSILLGKGHEEISDVIKAKDNAQREAMRNNILKHSSTLEEAAGRIIGYDECAEAIFEILEN
jgi:lipoate-protein ligase A